MDRDPQNTPRPSEEALPHINAIFVRRLEVLTVQTDRIEDVVKRIEEAMATNAQHLSALVSIAAANSDQLMNLTVAVERLKKANQEMLDSLGGMREGMRRTNERLRAVDGGQ